MSEDWDVAMVIQLMLRRNGCFLMLFLLLGFSPDTRAQPADQALLERGRYLVEIAGACGICHATRSPTGAPLAGMELAGGRIFVERGFRAVAPNITPDPETGIGRWTDAQIATAIRGGTRPDGSLLGQPMQVEAYRGISDRDLAAMVAFLRAAPPVRNAVTEKSAYPYALTSFGPPVVNVPDPPADDPVARGAYLAINIAHCMSCHTPALGPGRADPERRGATGLPFEGPWGVVVARNLSSSPEMGIGRWTDAQIRAALTQGVSADGHKLTPPMSARTTIWAKLAPGDMSDLIAYLRSLAPQDP